MATSLLEKVLDAIIRIDKHYNVNYVSDTGLTWMGEMPKRLLDCIHVDDQECLQQLIQAERESFSCDARFIRQGTTVWTNIKGFYLDASNEYMLCIVDISNWKEVDVTRYSDEQYLSGSFALAALNIDGFKKVNDSLGHIFGDTLLVQVAERIADALRKTDLVARVNGDEFALVLKGVTDQTTLNTTLLSILETIAAPFVDEAGQDIHLTASIGAAVFPQHATTYEELLKHTDHALTKAKQSGKNCIRFHTKAIQHTDISLESDMYVGIHEGDFSLAYQPQFNHDGEIIGAEALMRWDSSKFGKVGPDSFIPLAEENGLIIFLGTWALRCACHQLKKFQEVAPKFVIAVNVAPKQFRADKFKQTVLEALAESNITPSTLHLEITETTLMSSVDQVKQVLVDLKGRGISFAIDDFGTGFSSLSYIKRFPVSSLKIDKSFVRDLESNDTDKTIVKAIIGLAHSLGAVCVAEGVETKEQLAFLKQEGCDFLQGYLLGKPMSGDELYTLLASAYRVSK